MGNVIKAYRYRIVDNSAFEMPLPMKFTVWKADAPVADYIISEDEQVSYTIITKFKELMITTIHRPLDISDIYYMFSCRVFQDRTPFTKPILERMGLEKYNVCNILRRTHGISRCPWYPTPAARRSLPSLTLPPTPRWTRYSARKSSGSQTS